MLFDVMEFIFDLFSSRSRKRGPLAARAEVEGESLKLILENKGKRKLAFAAVRARDGDLKRCFPKSDVAARTVLASGSPVTATLALSELRAMDCRSLEVLDTSGHAWPVTGFDAASGG